LTNDDGITSPGLHAVRRELQCLGEVTVVAPDAERSAVGHAITTLTPLRIKQFEQGGERVGYAINGTPADCVKIALGAIMRDAKPDVVVSGINLGPNTATNVIYSGTVSAATEARILGVPSLAISLDTFHDPDWSYAACVGRRVAAEVLRRGLPPKVLLNVNVPNLPAADVKGVKITRQGDSAFVEDFTVREDPRGQPYLWLAGSYLMQDVHPDTDAVALKEGYVSITPITFDLTAHALLEEVGGWGLDMRGLAEA
jgi:5'-nucleotidase